MRRSRTWRRYGPRTRQVADVRGAPPIQHPTSQRAYREQSGTFAEAILDPHFGREVSEIIRNLAQEVRLSPSGGALSIKLTWKVAVCEN
jgi:hypothetical protein